MTSTGPDAPPDPLTSPAIFRNECANRGSPDQPATTRRLVRYFFFADSSSSRSRSISDRSASISDSCTADGLVGSVPR